MSTNKTTWSFDPTHSEIGFKVKHLMISNVRGNFSRFGGSVTTDGNDFSAALIDLSIESASIDTQMPDRDAHLKSPDFFDAEKFPAIVFKSVTMSADGDDEYKLTGNLTIKDVTLPVTLEVEFGGLMKDPWGNEKAGFTVTGKINRKDFGLTWNKALETGGAVVGDEVTIDLDIELVKAKKAG